MRIGLCLGLAAITAMAACARHPVETERGDVLGLWQFPDRSVWIEMRTDGSAVQCRIATDASVLFARGELDQQSIIRWNRIWGPDRVTIADDRLTIDGAFGVFAFERAVRPMDAACLAAR